MDVPPAMISTSQNFSFFLWKLRFLKSFAGYKGQLHELEAPELYSSQLEDA